VKVLPRDSNKFGSIQRHLGYIGRYGELALETDDGEAQQGKGIGRQLVQNWDLDLDEHRRQSDLAAVAGRKPPKLAHKLVFSMPAGTPPRSVLAAAKNFLREEFALRHRYAFVLHTDELHPHVHAVIKAVSEQGVRLHIKKATLREWRSEFARHLREQGIEANATDRQVRGETKTRKSDSIFRADRRGASTHVLARYRAVAADRTRGNFFRAEPGKLTLLATREEIEKGWHSVSDILATEGQTELAGEVKRFAGRLPKVQSDSDRIAAQFHIRTRG
jgi:hypothetical protein